MVSEVARADGAGHPSGWMGTSPVGIPEGEGVPPAAQTGGST